MSSLTEKIEAQLDAMVPYLGELHSLWKEEWRKTHPNSICNDGVTSPAIRVNAHMNEIRRILLHPESVK